MIRRFLLRPHIILMICFLAGLLQYLPVAINGGGSAEVTLWQFEEADLAEAGPLRYVKDSVVFVIALASLIYSPKLARQVKLTASLRRWWSIWAILVVLGVLPYVFDSTPSFLLIAGLRWLLLLLFSYYVWLVCFAVRMSERQERVLWVFLVGVSSVNLIFLLRQLGSVGSIYGLGIGAARLTGLFGSAGAASFFALSCALLAVSLRTLSGKASLLLLSIAFFGVLGTGTRFAMIAVFLLAVMHIRRGLKSARRNILADLFVLSAVSVGAVLYGVMIAAVDRGGIFEASVTEGGRLNNLVLSSERIMTSAPLEVLFGRGIGVGTNTGETMLIQHSIAPSSVRYHWLVDNAFLTFFFQYGLIGSAMFWGALFLFVRRLFRVSGPRQDIVGCICVVIGMTAFAGSPFEHYFLMLGFAAGLGLAAGGNIAPVLRASHEELRGRNFSFGVRVSYLRMR